MSGSPAGRPPQASQALTLRRADAGDAAAIASLHASRFERGWSAEEIAALLADPLVLAYAAETPGRRPTLAGFSFARVAAGEGEILMLAVARVAERLGVGSALVAATCACALDRGGTEVFLEVADDNAPALALYRRHGFRAAGRRPAYYGAGRAGDAIIMRLDLRDPVDGASRDS